MSPIFPLPPSDKLHWQMRAMSSSSSSSESALRMDAALVPVRSERSCSLRGAGPRQTCLNVVVIKSLGERGGGKR